MTGKYLPGDVRLECLASLAGLHPLGCILIPPNKAGVTSDLFPSYFDD